MSSKGKFGRQGDAPPRSHFKEGLGVQLRAVWSVDLPLHGLDQLQRATSPRSC